LDLLALRALENLRLRLSGSGRFCHRNPVILANFSRRSAVSYGDRARRVQENRPMRVVKVLSAIVALMGVVVLALVAAPAVYGQRSDRSDRRPSELTILAGGGGALGVSVRDLNPAETDKQKLQSGVVVDDVRADTAADKAGLKRGDVIVQ